MSPSVFRHGTYGLDGRLDEVALYKRVFTAAERTWLYNDGKGRTYAGVSLFYDSQIDHER